MTIRFQIAPRMAGMETSAIREILKVISKPGMISLAGGIPAPESFPMDLIEALAQLVFERYGSQALQYDRTEGFLPLQEALADYLRQWKDVVANPEDILVASGSQGILDALGKILVSPGDNIVVEAPTYLGAIQAFNPYEPRYIPVATDDDGVVPEALEAILQQQQIKFIYLVPTFQNPSGRTLSLKRRQEIADLIIRYKALLIEDDPYSLLRYQGADLPPIKTFAPDHVVYISTLSKILAPGLRIGFCVPPRQLKKWLVIVKQGVDLHTSTFNQALAAEYLSGGHMEDHLPKIQKCYAPRLRTMLSSLEVFFPSDYQWSRPDGGMFVWVRGPKGLDMEKIYWKSVEKNVAFVPGQYFFTQKGAGIETMRLNFTMADEKMISYAIQVLSEVLTVEESSEMDCLTPHAA